MTAVQWYIKKIKEAKQMCDDTSMEMDIWHTLDVLIEKGEQAKEMEKQQIIDAYDAGLFDGTMDDVNDRMYKQYYNETFNK